MSILETILNAQNGQALQQLGSQVGLGEQQTASALSALLPSLAAGLQKNLQQPNGLESLTTALSSGGHQQYLDDPSALADPSATADGNGILGHVLGGKDVSRDVASQVAAQTGISADVLEKLLPLAATLMMGVLAKKSSGGMASDLTGGGFASMLGSLLDRNGDGSVLDDVTGALGRFLGGT